MLGPVELSDFAVPALVLGSVLFLRWARPWRLVRRWLVHG